MKFVSKSSNLLIVLRPGLSAQPITGTPAKPTISVRFKDGVADVQQEELVAMMLAHPGFNGDFISAESTSTDPYAKTRQPSEPAHVLTEMRFGTPISKQTKGGNMQLPPEMQKVVQDLAAEMAKSMLPEMLKGLVAAHEANRVPSKSTKNLTKSGKPKGRPGRKPKNTMPEPTSVTESPLTQEEVS